MKNGKIQQVKRIIGNVINKKIITKEHLNNVL